VRGAAVLGQDVVSQRKRAGIRNDILNRLGVGQYAEMDMSQ
jgi:hypothetical protein